MTVAGIVARCRPLLGVVLVAALLTACSPGDRGVVAPPVTSAPAAPSESSPVVTPPPPPKENECTVELGGGRLSIDGDSPQMLSDGSGLSVSCAGGPYLLIADDGDDALALACEGEVARLKVGDDADIGPYAVDLAAQAGSEKVVLTMVLDR